MRSVYVFTDATAVVVDRALPVDVTDPDRVVQEVRIEDPPNWADEWDDLHLLHRLRDQFGHLPKRLVIIDISGRVPGHDEAIRAAEALRCLGPAAVLDDYSL